MLIITNGLKCVTNSKRSLKTLKNIFLSLSLPRDFLHVRRSRISNCSLKTDCISFFPSISGSSVRVTQFFKHSFSQETIGAKKTQNSFLRSVLLQVQSTKNVLQIIEPTSVSHNPSRRHWTPYQTFCILSPQKKPSQAKNDHAGLKTFPHRRGSLTSTASSGYASGNESAAAIEEFCFETLLGISPANQGQEEANAAAAMKVKDERT